MKYTSVAVLAALFAAVEAKPLNQMKPAVLAQVEDINEGSNGARTSRLGHSYKRDPSYEEPKEDYKPAEPYVPSKPYVPAKPKCPCKTCAAKSCDDLDPYVKCPYLFTDLGESITNTADDKREVLYGLNGQATLSGQNNGASSYQGVSQQAIPDVLKKTNQVENGNKKSKSKNSEDFSGSRKKTFNISGSIEIEETVEGGLCKAESSCEANTGENQCESITRIGDADAYVDCVASQSTHPEADCGECKDKKCYVGDKPKYSYKKPAAPAPEPKKTYKRPSSYKKIDFGDDEKYGIYGAETTSARPADSASEVAKTVTELETPSEIALEVANEAALENANENSALEDTA